MDKRINILVQDQGLRRLILQFITGQDYEIVQLKRLEDYDRGILLIGIECITFRNILSILGRGVNNIILIKTQLKAFKWYNNFVLSRYKAIITTPFRRVDFQRAIGYVFSIERRK